jgi:iron complex transport system substrate-binding protein
VALDPRKCLWHEVSVRLVSLTCSNTEIVCALGAEAWLVGVDDHSDHPTEVVARLPRVGPDLGIDVARVRALAPDLVLASLTVPGHERVVESLRRAGLPYLVTEPVSIEDVYSDVLQIGGQLGLSTRAEDLVFRMRAELDPLPAVPASRRRPLVLVEWWPKPVIVPGRYSWVCQMLERAGGTGVLDDADVKSRAVTDDEVQRLDPDAVVIAWCGVPFRKYRTEVVARRPAWRDVKAVRNGRIYPVPEAFLGRPGPRLEDGVHALFRVVQDASGV